MNYERLVNLYVMAQTAAAKNTRSGRAAALGGCQEFLTLCLEGAQRVDVAKIIRERTMALMKNAIDIDEVTE